MVALVLTIVVMLILVTITVRTGISSIEHSRMASFVSRMQLIQKKVDFLAEKNEYNELGNALNTSQKTMTEAIITAEKLNTDKDNTTLKYFNKAAIINQLEIENIDDEIVIDFATREVISLNGIEYEDKMYYTQYNLPGGQKVIANPDSRKGSFNTPEATIYGLNATFTISGITITNGTLYYSRDNKQTWTEITNYTVEGQDVVTQNLVKSGIYYFKLVDNVTGEEYILTDSQTGEEKYIQLRLANAPQLKENLGELSQTYDYSSLDSTKWAYATDSETGNVYVWIPRFAFESANTTNIEFLRGTSYVTTSENYLPSSGWTIPEPLKNVTGIWVKVNSVDADNTSILDNIIDNNIGGLIIL